MTHKSSIIRIALLQCCAIMLTVLVGGCGQISGNSSIPKESTGEIAALRSEISRLRAQIQESKKEEIRVQTIVQLLVSTLVAMALFLAWAFHAKMVMLKNWLWAKPWGQWVVWGAACIYLTYDIFANASLITNLLLK